MAALTIVDTLAFLLLSINFSKYYLFSAQLVSVVLVFIIGLGRVNLSRFLVYRVVVIG